MKIALVIFITLALAGCALLSLHMGVIPVPWRALLTDWQAGREHYYVLMGTDCRACCWHCLSVQPSPWRAC